MHLITCHWNGNNEYHLEPKHIILRIYTAHRQAQSYAYIEQLKCLIKLLHTYYEQNRSRLNESSPL